MQNGRKAIRMFCSRLPRGGSAMRSDEFEVSEELEILDVLDVDIADVIVEVPQEEYNAMQKKIAEAGSAIKRSMDEIERIRADAAVRIQAAEAETMWQ